MGCAGQLAARRPGGVLVPLEHGPCGPSRPQRALLRAFVGGGASRARPRIRYSQHRRNPGVRAS
eukprot:9187968-Lingulodinium_polyedra.AAC.1